MILITEIVITHLLVFVNQIPSWYGLLTLTIRSTVDFYRCILVDCRMRLYSYVDAVYAADFSSRRK